MIFRSSRHERIGPLVLPAGVLVEHEITKAELEELRQAQGGRLKRLERAGIVEVNPDWALPPRGQVPSSLESFTVEEAVDLVRAVDDAAQIDAWLRGELAGKNRSTLLDRLEARLEELAGS